MQLTPLDQIDEYATLKTMFEEVSSITASEVYDPEALIRRCAVIAAEIPRLVNITIVRIRTEAALALREILDSGRLPPQSVDVLKPRLLAAYASEEELTYLASTRASSYSTIVFLRVARYSFLTAAFVVSFVIAELVAARLPAVGSSVISRLSVGILAFVVQLSVLGNAGERVERLIRWQIFERRRQKLLLALTKFIEVCSRAWNEANSLIPMSY